MAVMITSLRSPDAVPVRVKESSWVVAQPATRTTVKANTTANDFPCMTPLLDGKNGADYVAVLLGKITGMRTRYIVWFF
jgi:hypothetical protein